MSSIFVINCHQVVASVVVKVCVQSPSLDQYEWEYNAPDPQPERQTYLLEAQLRNAALLFERFRQSGSVIPVFPFPPPFFLQPAPHPSPPPPPPPSSFLTPPLPPQHYDETMSEKVNDGLV